MHTKDIALNVLQVQHNYSGVYRKDASVVQGCLGSKVVIIIVYLVKTDFSTQWHSSCIVILHGLHRSLYCQRSQAFASIRFMSSQWTIK